jgi:hypothetical protein
MKKIVGYSLFILSNIAWTAIAILPFLDLSIEMAATITTALVVGGEVAFLLSVTLLGKEFLEKIKDYFKRVKMFFTKK